ncbi:MAG: S46 family peptidase [Prevotellaceae bacterium]|jgi:hypothetical protein|nr:S46 family peptidase [Prevotellaceae bacterium]
MNRLVTALALVSILTTTRLQADEGMWMLPLIEKLNIKDMKRAGCKLSPEQIYAINKASLKDAVVIFAGGCTGEVISDQGLVLTNHHCGYSAIQSHSTLEHDYLKEGFWARNQSEELHTPGLNVLFLERIEDVSEQIMPEANSAKSEIERDRIVSRISDSITKQAGVNPRTQRARVVAMYGGNAYYLFIYKIYNDIRMVGAPPSSIGHFGDETDNWMWPRHTGDFSLFRIYADAEGNPADYSPQNQPLKPKYHIPISLKGFQVNDFAMVLGFPGSTQRYMTSWEVAERMSIENANRIKIRGIRQEIMKADMNADPKVRIQYANKYNTSSNYWKNSIGMNRALTQLNVIEQKQLQEETFANMLSSDAQINAQYGDALKLIESAVKNRASNLYASQYIYEALWRGCEITSFARRFIPLYEALKEQAKPSEERIQQMTVDLIVRADKFFKDYNTPTDRKIAAAMFKLYSEDVPAADQAKIFPELKARYGNNWQEYANNLFNKSLFVDVDKVGEFLKSPSVEIMDKDPLVKLVLSINSKETELSRADSLSDVQYTEGRRKYIAGLQLLYKGKRNLYPDANFTMRLTYGTIKGYTPADAKQFSHLTTLKGVIEKEDPNNSEFHVPQKLKTLFNNKDFGRYAAKDGRMPVNFIFDGDITGGNSGSPVLNSKGELIGTAFDGNWEAMSGDLAFEHNLQRCINVDIRYILFIIDKYAEAGYLLNEMTIRN